MSLLDELGPSTVGRLAEQDRCSQPTMTGLVNGMVERGWAERTPHPDDSRANLVSLTSLGRRNAGHAAPAQRRPGRRAHRRVRSLRRRPPDRGHPAARPLPTTRKEPRDLHRPARHDPLAPPKESILQQPRAVWAVAFACVIAFMGIGLVDPILKPIADQLDATPSQVSLLFTSYMAVMGVAMLVTGVVSSRIGAKRTLLCGLLLIIVFSALAGSSDTIGAIVGFRAGWGLGNALFIATALATIVMASRGSTAQAVILFEAALGLGIAAGPIVGGQLGELSWRAPFYGVAVLMSVALLATAFFLPHHSPGGPSYVPDRSVQGTALPGSADDRDHRALLQHGLLHAAGVRARSRST